jgi:Tol biopolymer transport system component
MFTMGSPGSATRAGKVEDAMVRATIRGVAAGLVAGVLAAVPAVSAPLQGNGVIVFDRHRDHNWDIYVKRPSRGHPAIRLTTSRADDFAPSFSPDGRRVAFTSDRGGNYDIYTMNSAGRDLRRITTNPGKDAFPSWSPSGRRLAFASNRTGDWELYTTNANGSRHLVRVTRRAGVDSLPVWSPDGTRLAFDAPRNRHYQICVVPAGGGTITVMTSGTARNVQPAWSPDGSRIAFTSNRSGSFDLWTIAVAGRALHRLTSGASREIQPAWSPDGGRILFARKTPAGETIDVMPAGGGPVTVLTGRRGNEIPHWQPVTATTVTGLSPDHGPSAGGTTVTITGHGFVARARVRFGSAAATGVVVHSPASITATSPAGTGTVDVVVTTSRGTSATAAGDRFTYQ